MIPHLHKVAALTNVRAHQQKPLGLMYWKTLGHEPTDYHCATYHKYRVYNLCTSGGDKRALKGMSVAPRCYTKIAPIMTPTTPHLKRWHGSKVRVDTILESKAELR